VVRRPVAPERDPDRTVLERGRTRHRRSPPPRPRRFLPPTCSAMRV